MIALLLIWGGEIRYNNYLNFQDQLAHKSVSGASNELHLYIRELRRSVRLFAAQEHEIIRHLANSDIDLISFKQLEKKVKQHFPEHFSFTITSKEGISLLDGFDDLVGNGCKRDIAQFSTDTNSHHIYVHSSPLNNPYHFDLMVPWGANEGIFFISFNLKNISQILKNAETIDHDLLLLKKDNHGAIEITSQGSTKLMAENNLSWFSPQDSMEIKAKHTLSPSNIERIEYEMTVAGTLWTLIDLPHINLYSSYNKTIAVQHLSIFIVFFFVIGIMSYFLYHSNKKLLTTMDNLESLNNQKNKLFSIIGHDLRTPFIPITFYAETLVNNANKYPTEEVIKRANIIKESSERALELLDDLLNWARLQDDGYPIVIEEVKVKDIVMRTIDLYSVTAEAKGCTLLYETEDISVFADINALDTSIRNLVANAIKFTKDSVIKIGAISQKDSVKIYVKDKGVGMDEDTCQKIFNSAIYHTTVGTSGEKGTGLGLSLCEELITKQKGSISVESILGEGSTFSILLPKTKT